MLTKFSYLRESLHRIAKEAPMELIACILFYMVAVISFSMNDKAENWLWSFPACFCLIFVVNRLTVASPTRWVYYLSVFFYSRLLAVGFAFGQFHVLGYLTSQSTAGVAYGQTTRQ